MAKLGYARVSTNQQMLNIQIEAWKAQGVRKGRIFSDKTSGKDTDRPGPERLLNRAEDGDEVPVTKLVGWAEIPSIRSPSLSSSMTAVSL